MNKRLRTRRALAVAATAAAAVVACTVTRPAYAADGSWTGAAGDGLWQTPGNWTANTIPGSLGTTTNPDTATFAGHPASLTVAIDANRNIGSLFFDPDNTQTTTYLIGAAGPNAGNPLILSNGGTTQLSSVDFPGPTAVSVAFNAPIRIAGSSYSFINNSGNTSNTFGGLQVFGNITNATSGATTITLDGDHGSSSSSRAELYGVISDGTSGGTTGVVKNGIGTWEMDQPSSAPNTYSGDTIIKAGILRASSGSNSDGIGGFSANSHYVIKDGATLRNSVTGSSAKSIEIDFGGTLAASSTTANTINLTSNAGPALQLNFGAPTNSTLVRIRLPINLTGTAPDQGGITLVAASGASGTPQVEIGDPGSAFGLGPVRRVFDIGRGADANDWDLRIRGAMSGSAGFVKTGAGTLRLESNLGNYTGTVEIRAGTVNPSSNNAMAGTSLLINGGTLLVQSGQSQAFQAFTVNKGEINGGNATAPATVSAPGFNFLVAGADTASQASAVILADFGGPSPLLKDGAGSVTLSGILNYTGATTVNAGILSLATNLTSSSSVSVTGGKLELRVTAQPNRVLKTPSLSVTGSGKIDIKHNKIITATPVGSTTGGVYNGVSGLIQSGRNGGGWGGNGIVTSMSDATGGNFTSIGVATAQQVKGLANAADTVVFAGQTVTGSDTLVMYTYGGDANLDGKINVDDYGHIDSSIPIGIAGWFNGDFNYDGKINVDDYGIIDFNIGIQGAPFPTAVPATAPGASLVAVPEPAAGALMCIGLAAMTGRRRRKRVGQIRSV